MKILIVGAGFSGSVIARCLAEANYSIDIIDQRNHVAGNAYDYENEHGIRVHKYGPHLYHTNNSKVHSWLSKFTEWYEYKHKVKAMLSDGSLVTLPVNRETAAIVGKENIVDTFFRPYTKKMWGLEIEELDPKILSRVPIRDDDNQYYFPNDTFQALPKNGYTSLVDNILNHKGINLSLNTSFHKDMEGGYDHIFNSMAIDEYFDYKYGALPYRSVKFHNVLLPMPKVFNAATINFTHNGPFTRVTEWKNLPNHGTSDKYSLLTYEEPCCYTQNNYERFYPVKDLNNVNRNIYKKYVKLIPNNIDFIGRCGQYVYIDMHQAVSSGIAQANSFLKLQKKI